MEAIIQIEFFDLYQKVYIYSKANDELKPYSMTISDIPDFLMTLPELDKVHIFGNEDVIYKTISEIREKESQKYHFSKIEFFINK